MDLKGRVALVTGSSRGLGKATALALARAGAKVAVNYLRSEALANEVVAEITEGGGNAISVQADITSATDIDRLGKTIETDLGPIEILVNNAGEIVRPGEWDQLVDDALDYTFAVNIKSVILCIQRFAPSMIKSRFGRIINLTTTYAMTGAAPVLAYTAAKAGIIPVTYAMARELGQHGVTVNALAPGNFDTDMTAAAGEGAINWAVSTTPLARLGQPHEVGEAVVFVASSDFINGHILVIDGGQLLNM